MTATTTVSAGTGRRTPMVLLAVLLAPPAVTVMLLVLTGGVTEAPSFGLPDPGPITRWGLPTMRGVRVAATAVTLGALTLIAVVLPAKDSGLLSKAQLGLANLAAVAGSIWLWSAVAEFVLAYSDISGRPPTAASTTELWFFATEYELGASLSWSILAAGFVAFVAVTARTVTGIAVALLGTVTAVWAVALTGHAADDANHDLAVNVQFVHLLAIGLWFGGLVALVWIRRHPDLDLATLARRYSRTAGWCYAAVALSGVIAAVLRIPTLDGVASTYGAVLGVKVVAFTALGCLGWWQRRRLLPALDHSGGDSHRSFVRFALVEVVFMAVAAGAGTALNRTPPPAGPETAAPTPGEALLGYPMPPPLGLSEWFTQWRIDSFWMPVALAAAVLYLAGVRRLRQRGDRWSWGRTTAWLVGCAGLVWATSGSPGAYGDVLFSMHMVQHMTIATAVPTFLVLGAPVTLALRALRRRGDGSRGAREWLLVLVHSWPPRLLGHPIVATALFIVGMVAFYYSSLFEQSLRSHTMHLLMTGHFLFSGYLFANVACGIDPGPRRPIYPLRVLLIMVAFGFHAFFSISLMSAEALLAGDWFTALGRPWGQSPADDQYLGASLGWGLGEYPLAILAGAVIWAWVRDDHREATRLDRQADRDNDQALQSYNDYLRTLGRAAASERDRN